MKVFAVLAAAVATVSADSDPVLVQTPYGVVDTPTTFAGIPPASQRYAFGRYASAPYALNAYSAYGAIPPYGAVHALGKRDADADSDPALVQTPYGVVNSPYNFAGIPAASQRYYNAYAHTLSPYSAYSAVGYPYAHAIGKRDADADSDPVLVQTPAGIVNTPYTFAGLPAGSKVNNVRPYYGLSPYSAGVVSSPYVNAYSPYAVNPYFHY